MRQKGFTLVELLLLLGLSATLVHWAVPTFKGSLEAQQRLDSAQSLANGLRYARNEAILRNSNVVIRALEGDWGQGWQVVLDLSRQGTKASQNPVLLEHQDSAAVSMVGNGPVKDHASFNSLGEPWLTAGGFRAGTVHVCAANQPLSLHQVVLAPSGRISLRSDKAEQVLCGD